MAERHSVPQELWQHLAAEGQSASSRHARRQLREAKRSEGQAPGRDLGAGPVQQKPPSLALMLRQ